MWRRDDGTWAPTLSSRGVTGEGQGPRSCSAPGGQQRAGALVPAAGRAVLGSAASASSKEGRERGPWGAGPGGPAWAAPAAPAPFSPSGARAPLSRVRACRWPARRRQGWRAHSAAPAARGPWFILHSGRLSPRVSLLARLCGGEGDTVKEPLLRPPTASPPAHTAAPLP